MNTRLLSPYLTQGRNYRIPKFYIKWTHSPETTNRTQCKFKLDKVMVNPNGIIRKCCLKYEGHGEEHSYNEYEIIKLNKMSHDVLISLAWIQHIKNEFGEKCW